MRYKSARFTMFDARKKLCAGIVDFCTDADGLPAEVHVLLTDAAAPGGLRTVELENIDGRWKPCATHAASLIRHVLKQKAAGNQEAKRRKDTLRRGERPKLKLVGGKRK